MQGEKIRYIDEACQLNARDMAKLKKMLEQVEENKKWSAQDIIDWAVLG